MTGYPDSDLMARALEIGPFTMISKPVDYNQIQKVVDRIVAPGGKTVLKQRPTLIRQAVRKSTADNVADTVIADGFRTIQEVCVGDVMQTDFCKENS